MTIKVLIKNNYGQESIYPMCEQGKLFAKLLNQKTFTKPNIETIKQLGYTFKVCNEFNI